MIGSAISGGLKLAGGIFGGITAAKAARQAKKNLEQQREKNQNWYDRRYNEDATQRADAQRMLTTVEEGIRRRNRQAAGAQAVMGGTDESVAAEKALNNQALADVASQIVVNGEARKDNIEQQYMQTDAQITRQLNQMEMDKANAISKAVQGVTSAASDIKEMFGGAPEQSASDSGVSAKSAK